MWSDIFYFFIFLSAEEGLLFSNADDGKFMLYYMT